MPTYIYIYLDGVYLVVCPCKMCMCIVVCVCVEEEKKRERQDENLVNYINGTQVISSAIFIDGRRREREVLTIELIFARSPH